MSETGLEIQDEKLTPGNMEPGFYSPLDLEDQIRARHQDSQLTGKPPGLVTDMWTEFDEHFRFVPGEFTLITGHGSHGKSAFLDDYLRRLVSGRKMLIGFVSLENIPIEKHIIKHMVLLNGRKFYGTSPAIRENEIPITLNDLHQYFRFFHPGDRAVSIDSIMRAALAIHKRTPLSALVLDPWNEFEHLKFNVSHKMTSDEYLSQCLSKLRRFGQNEGIHIFIVAHPKLPKDSEQDPVPVVRPYMIAGGAAWRAKADHIWSVYRTHVDGVADETEVHFFKIREEESGNKGSVKFSFDRNTRRFTEVGEQQRRLDEQRQLI